jgi:hypothetical protein
VHVNVDIGRKAQAAAGGFDQWPAVAVEAPQGRAEVGGGAILRGVQPKIAGDVSPLEGSSTQRNKGHEALRPEGNIDRLTIEAELEALEEREIRAL